MVFREFSFENKVVSGNKLSFTIVPLENIGKIAFEVDTLRIRLRKCATELELPFAPLTYLLDRRRRLTDNMGHESNLSGFANFLHALPDDFRR